MSKLEDLTGGWEQCPPNDVFVLEGVPTRGWIHDVAVWTECAALLQPLIDAMPDPTGVRSQQSCGKGWLPMGPLTWSDAGHRQWTTRHAHLKHLADYGFSETECASPSWKVQDERKKQPNLDILIGATMPCTFHGKPRGARHSIRIALRDGWLERVGEKELLASLAAMATKLTATQAWRTRYADLLNLQWPWVANPRLHKGGKRWTHLPDMPLQAAVDPIPLPPDSFTARTARHPDGRAVTTGMYVEGIALTIRDADGDVVTRRRRERDPEAAMAAQLAELVAEGFVVEPGPA